MKKIIVLISVFVLFIAFILPLILVDYFNVAFDELGAYGDFFGGFNALVSVLAFGGLIYTIFLQRKDLELQREELKQTRDELKRQAEAQEKTAQEQARHAKILEEQLYKEIRPYLNTYFTHENDLIYLVIKNIGKSACYDFSMRVESYDAENNCAEEILKKLKVKLESTNFSVIPSGLDYVIECELKNKDIFECLMSSSITVNFIFYFRKKEDRFTISFKFDEIQSHGDPEVRAIYAVANAINMGHSI